MHFSISFIHPGLWLYIKCAGGNMNVKLYIDLFLKTIKPGFICTGRHSNGTERILLNDILEKCDLPTFANHVKRV